MESNGNNLRRLAEYCDEFRLTLRVNGTVAGGVRGEGRKNGKAIDDFDASIELNPNDPPVYFFRGNMHFKLYDRVKADADFARAKEMGYEPEEE
mgnify:CR=1 FL=1